MFSKQKPSILVNCNKLAKSVIHLLIPTDRYQDNQVCSFLNLNIFFFNLSNNSGFINMKPYYHIDIV